VWGWDDELYNQMLFKLPVAAGGDGQLFKRRDRRKEGPSRPRFSFGQIRQHIRGNEGRNGGSREVRTTFSCEPKGK